METRSSMKRNTTLDSVRYLVSGSKAALGSKGVTETARSGLSFVVSYINHSLSRSSQFFTMSGVEYRYFCHLYNLTWCTERAVEVPIIWELARRYEGKRV